MSNTFSKFAIWLMKRLFPWWKKKPTTKPTPTDPIAVLEPRIGFGIGNPFIFFDRDDGGSGVRHNIMGVLDGIKETQAVTTCVRANMNHWKCPKCNKIIGGSRCKKCGSKAEGPWIHPLNNYKNINSGWNDLYWELLARFCRDANALGCTVMIQLFDANYINWDCYTRHFKSVQAAYGGTVHSQQERYMDKMIGTVDKYAVCYELTNEVLFTSPRYPLPVWSNSAIGYLRSITGRKLGADGRLMAADIDFKVFHGGAKPYSSFFVNNEETVGNPPQYGGSGTLAQYQAYLSEADEHGFRPILASWDRMPAMDRNQVEALKWAKGKGWY